MRIEGRASGGELHLDLPRDLISPRVELEGWTGIVVDQGANLVLTSLEGEGAVVLLPRG